MIRFLRSAILAVLALGVVLSLMAFLAVDGLQGGARVFIIGLPIGTAVVVALVLVLIGAVFAPQPTRRAYRVSLGLVISIVCLFVVFGPSAFYVMTTTPEEREERREARACEDDIAAYGASKTYVERHLVSPASADFPSITAPRVGIHYLGDCRHEVIAYVDAQNGFGATVRVPYRAIMQYAGDGYWRGQDIHIDDF